METKLIKTKPLGESKKSLLSGSSTYSSDSDVSEHDVIRVIKLQQENEKSSDNEKKQFYMHPILLTFKDPLIEKKFQDFFMSLDKPANRLILNSVFGFMANFVGVFALNLTGYIEEGNLESLIIFICGSIIIFIQLLAAIFTVILSCVCLNVVRKYVHFFEIFFTFVMSWVSFNMAFRWQKQMFSISLQFLLMFCLGRQGRFCYNIYGYFLQIIGVTIGTVFPNIIFDADMKNSDALTVFPVFVYFVNFFILSLFDYLLERKNRNKFINIIKLSKREKEIEIIHKEVKNMLRDILPPFFVNKIIKGLMEKDKYLLEIVDHGSCVFADLASFTKYAEKQSPLKIMSILNSIFTYFDILSLRLSLEKVSTQGDAFISIGVKGENETHLKQSILFGYGMMNMLERLSEEQYWGELKIRVGISYGKLYLVCLGSLETGVNFDVHGKTIAKAQVLQQKGNASTIVVEDEVKIMSLSHVEEEGNVLKGRGDDFFKFEKIKDSNDLILSKEFIIEKKLQKYINEIINESFQMGKLEIKQLKLDYFKSTVNQFSANITLSKEQIEGNVIVEKQSVRKKLSNVIKMVMNLFPRIGKDDQSSYNPFLMIFKNISYHLQYEKMKVKSTIVYSLLFFVSMLLYSVLYLIYFLTLGKFSFFFESPFAYGLYVAIFVQIISLLLYPLIVRVFYIHHIVSFINLTINHVSILLFVFFLPFNNEDKKIRIGNIDAIEELYHFFLIFSICVTPITPLLKIPFLLIHLVSTFLYRILNFGGQGVGEHVIGTILMCFIGFFSLAMLDYFDAFNFVKVNSIKKRETLLKKEHEKVENLILSILPVHIFESLKKYNEDENIQMIDALPQKKEMGTLGEKTFGSLKCFVFFVKLINFEVLFKRNVKNSIVLLSRIFHEYDYIIKMGNGIKIKSLENVYIFISENNKNGIQIFKRIVHCTIKEIKQQKEDNVIFEKDNIYGLHCGMSFGEVCSGVLGSLKYRFDVIGSFVNLSSRLCSSSSKFNGMENTIHLMDDTIKYLEGVDFSVLKKAVVDLKGIGKCNTSFIT